MTVTGRKHLRRRQSRPHCVLFHQRHHGDDERYIREHARKSANPEKQDQAGDDHVVTEECPHGASQRTDDPCLIERADHDEDTDQKQQRFPVDIPQNIADRVESRPNSDQQ